MTTQTISGAAILMREYIKLGMKVGSRVRVAKKVVLENILWVDEMDESIGQELAITVISESNFDVMLSNGCYYPIESLDLIIEPDEMPFEGTVPDGWELCSKERHNLELFGANKISRIAWVHNEKEGAVFFLPYYLLTLKRKK